jgi:hypothetical protein
VGDGSDLSAHCGGEEDSEMAKTTSVTLV